MIAWVHGGVAPVCAHGSREITIVAPRAAAPAFEIATTSAWSIDLVRS